MGQMLSPPLLSGIIPAFYSNESGIVITIPFSMNRVVSLSQVDAFQVKIKTIQSGHQLYSERIEKLSNQDNYIKLTIPKEHSKYSSFRVGQSYKIQIAYINDGTIGYYSTVGIAKYTTIPEMNINNLDTNNLNSHLYTYTGVYNQSNKDTAERVHTYQFNLYDSKNNLISTSGELLHDTTLDDSDNPGISQDTYTFSQDLDLGETYRIEYKVITINGLTVSSPRYRLTQKQSINPEIDVSLLANLNYENGYVDIDLKTNNSNQLSTGFFIVSRACEDSDYKVWDEVFRFSLASQLANLHLCKDFTVEQGKNYIYGLQQYNNNNLYSNRILSDIIKVDFEDAFLYDGKRQLKIKYNPKVSTFKKDLLETKVDTIGGKHPFIFRNGRVYYSEFPISGLISYQMDEENLFLSEEDYTLTEKTTNLTGDNIAAERFFKMEVLKWLTNGEPKIFRSPTEGNFIVRLMNSSLTPNDTVGRMLHTFNCTAYEVADFNYQTLGEMNFIHIEDQLIESLQWETIEFKDLPIGQNLLKYTAQTIRFDNMTPGDVITLNFENNDSQNIKIGITGSYYVDLGVTITGVQLNTRSFGSMTYSYYYVKEPAFNSIEDIDILEMPQHQFIGEHDILKELLYVYDGKEWIKNPKVEITTIYRIDVEKRPLQRTTDTNTSNLTDAFLIYDIGEYKEDSPTVPGRLPSIFITKKYYDGYNQKEYQKYEPFLTINNNITSVNEIEKTEYIRPEKVIELKSGNGVLVNMSYQMGVITFSIEKEAIKVSDKNHYLYTLGQSIKIYNKAIEDLEDKLTNGNETEISAVRINVRNAETNYIIELVKAQTEESRRKGEIV